jgi:glutaredoxin-related protein
MVALKPTNFIRMREEHPLLDEIWKIRQVDLPAIDVPAFIVRPLLLTDVGG